MNMMSDNGTVVDFTLMGNGRDTVLLLIPVSEAGKRWADEHLPEDCTRLGDGIAIEPRFIVDILDGIAGDGLGVKA